MAEMNKINYPSVKTYIAQMRWKTKPVMLMLGYDVNNRFQFIDLNTGRIMNLNFKTVDDAEQWLKVTGQILEKDTICQTYVP